MPEDDKNRFLLIAQQIDALTDSMGHGDRHRPVLDAIKALRLERDQLASQYSWKAIP